MGCRVCLCIIAASEFRRVQRIQATEIKGRKRVYFSRDPDALRASGSTTKPKPVPETPFWVITNTNTSRKQNMVAQLMTSMGYGDEVIARVCGAI